jgi:hypothetical protein
VPLTLDQVKAPTRPFRRKVRYATRRSRILPTFLIIGAQRAATTSLFTNLRRHPEVIGPRTADTSVAWWKELHFFDENYWRGTDWYRAFFPLEIRQRASRRFGRELACGEATPYYLFHPAVPERVQETLPDVRLVALLRNPVERAYSHYQHMRLTGREKLTFAEAIDAEERRVRGAGEELLRDKPSARKQGNRRHHEHRHRAYVGRGLYAEQLERWFAQFPREQLLVLRSEDLLARPDEIYARAFAFLGVREWSPGGLEARNVASYAPIEPELRARLEKRFAEPNERLVELLGPEFRWESGIDAPGTSPGAILRPAQPAVAERTQARS